MMLAFNLSLLFKMDFVTETENRQQIKTFRTKLYQVPPKEIT